jgi:hypothetical protein
VVESRRNLVPVHVPVDRLQEVYALLASPPRSSAAVGTTDVPSPWTPPASNGLTKVPWTEDELQAFINSGTKTARVVTALVDILVSEPGAQFTTSTLMKRLDVGHDELRGVLAALSRHVRAHYRRTNWFFKFTWGPELGPDFPAEAHYSISPEVAAAWIRARKAS